MEYEHDNLENDTGNSGSEFSHIYHDTKEDGDKPEMVFWNQTYNSLSIPAKKSRPFQKDFSISSNKRWDYLNMKKSKQTIWNKLINMPSYAPGRYILRSNFNSMKNSHKSIFGTR